MLQGNFITVVIPALNEAESIGQVIAEIPKIVDEIIVVDNGSTDKTADTARAGGARVIHESVRGYGAACLAGIASAGDTDIVAFIDADYSDFPSDLEALLIPVASGECDLAVGCRFPDKKHVIPIHQRWGNWISCRMINFLYGSCYRDLGPMRCIRKISLDRMSMCDQSYGWTSEMQIKAAKYNIRVTEIPVQYRQRIGQSKISGTAKGSFLAAYGILYWIFKLILPAGKVTVQTH